MPYFLIKAVCDFGLFIQWNYWEINEAKVFEIQVLAIPNEV